MSKRLPAFDRSTVSISYRPRDAIELRKFASTIILNGDSSPSLSLLSRRALQVYISHIMRVREMHPAGYETEVAALEKLTAYRQRSKARTK